jgi:hypothetical protein
VPVKDVNAATASGRVDNNANVIHGAATDSRAAFTVHDWRADISPRVRRSSRKRALKVRNTCPRSLPPTSRAIRSEAHTRSATGSDNRSCKASSDCEKEPLARYSASNSRNAIRSDAGPRRDRSATASGNANPARTAEASWSTASGQACCRALVC